MRSVRRFSTVLAAAALCFINIAAQDEAGVVEDVDALSEAFFRARIDVQLAMEEEVQAGTALYDQRDIAVAVENIFYDHHPDRAEAFWRDEASLELIEHYVSVSAFMETAFHIPGMVARAEALFAIAREREEVTPRMVGDLHHAYVALRRFEDAAAMRKAYPDAGLREPPAILKNDPPAEGERVLLTVNDDGTAFEETFFDFASFSGLIFINHPSCGFCRLAVDAASKDAELAALMTEDTTLWLTTAYSPLDAATAGKAWPVKTHFAYLDSDWPEIFDSGTPSFYFIKDGAVASYFACWRKDEEAENLEKLRRGLAAVLD